MELRSSDVNFAYVRMLDIALEFGEWETTRNGRALVIQEPILIHHFRPERRVLFDPVRDANPFFHYMEALWVLSGRNDLDFISQFAKSVLDYSDDGETWHGAYGWRLDTQLGEICEMLKKDPNSRRCVATIWDRDLDLGKTSKDLPCNTHLYFANRHGKLELTVCNRSNDLVWGMLGSNIVTFSIIQEYMAGALGIPMGALHQFSNNVHVYEGWEYKCAGTPDGEYPEGPCIQFGPKTLDEEEVHDFVCGERHNFKSDILNKVALPMLRLWETRDPATAEGIFDPDWRLACNQWVQRRQK